MFSRGMDPIVQWYKSEVFFWRNVASQCWSIVILFLVTFLFISLSHNGIWQPWFGFSGALSTIMSYSFLFSMASISILLVAINYTAVYSVVPHAVSTSFTCLTSLLAAHRLPHLCVSVFGGLWFMWLTSGLVPHRYCSMSAPITGKDGSYRGFNEAHFFLVISGVFAGLIYYCNFYQNHLFYLNFLSIQRYKFFRVRAELLPLWTSSICLACKHVCVFYLFYWMLGGGIRSWIMGLFNFNMLAEHYPMDSFLVVVMDLPLLWQTFLSALFLFYAWNLTSVLHRVYHTQRLEMPVNIMATFNVLFRYSLSDCLPLDTDPILQHLAFLDLAYLSDKCHWRRLEVFSLSQRGGHPVTWRSVCQSCLSQIHNLMTSLQTELVSVSSSKLSAQTPTTVNWSAPFAGIVNSPVFGHSHRNVDRSSLSVKEDSSLPVGSLPDLPHQPHRQPFPVRQVHILAVEAISQLAVASYTEDRHGVVQHSLPSIFIAITMLQETVEAYFKQKPIAMCRPHRLVGHVDHHVILCHQIRSVLKTAIYRLTIRFGKDLSNLQLPDDCTTRLQPFLQFRE